MKKKRGGMIKGRVCCDGRKYRRYMTKDDTISPTVLLETLVMLCIIDATERRNVDTANIPLYFMQTDM